VRWALGFLFQIDLVLHNVWNTSAFNTDHLVNRCSNGHWGSLMIIFGATGDRQESFWGQLGFIKDHSGGNRG
jgi:hypothetical protein